MLAAIVLLALHLLTTTEAVNFYKCPEESPIIGDDTASGPITLTPSIPFYGGYYNTAYVGRNGIVQFQTPPSTNKETIGVFPVAGSIFVAPFYSDLAQNGDVTWCYSNETEQIEQQIRRNFNNFSSLEFAIIATWNNIGYFNDSPALRNTFQCVIATDGSTSFALFLYDKLQANPAHVGFNNGSEDIFSELPCSNNPEVGMDGLWLFRIDQNTIEPSCTNRATCKECSCQEYQAGGCICNRNKDEEEKSCTPDTPSTGPQATPSAVQPTPSPTNSVKTGGNETNRRSGLPVWAIGAIVGVVLFFAIIVAVACTYCCYKYKWCADVENGKRGGRSSPIDESSVSPDDGTATINNGCNSVSYKKDQ